MRFLLIVLGLIALTLINPLEVTHDGNHAKVGILRPVSIHRPSDTTTHDPVSATTAAATKPAPQLAPVAIAPVAPAPAPTANGCSGYAGLFDQYSWNVADAEAICEAESGGNPNALSPTCDRGLMQVNCVHADMVNGDLSQLYIPSVNIAVAYRIYSARGWSAWTTAAGLGL
jgi:soluble lytic murein transglycosylase-like protein